MLIYHKPAPPKPQKRRSRAGCISCKQKKKKCNEKRPQCDRCEEKNLQCEYETVKPRKRKRQPLGISHQGTSHRFQDEDWSSHVDEFHERSYSFDNPGLSYWETDSSFVYPNSEQIEHVEHVDEVEDDLEDAVPSAPGSNHTATLSVRSKSQYPDLAMIAPSPVCSPLLEFCAPVFMEFSDKRNRRGLVHHFCTVLSHLIVFKEDTGNPFQRLVLPLSHDSSPILDAIFALSSAHLENRGIGTEENSLFFHNKALQGLAKLLDSESTNREEVLGAIMLLVYYEVLVQRGNSNMVNGHLRGALTVMRSHPQPSTPSSLFLERAFRFYDVITALSYGTAPISTSPSPMAPLNLPSTPSPSPLNSVDSLLGMATDLWPIIYRLSHLRESRRDLQVAEACGNTSKACVLRTELESTSNAIEHALTNWLPSINWPADSVTSSPPSSKGTSPNTTVDHSSPPQPSSQFLGSPPQYYSTSADSTSSANDTIGINNDTSDPAADSCLHSILNNAEAYRHAALVFLYRDIQCLPRRHPLVQRHVSLALSACSAVVEWAGPMSALLWPMFVAAVEAIGEDDREKARNAFVGTERRQGMRNILTAWGIVEEVWRRWDEGLEEGWRDVADEKGINIVFG